MQFDACRAGIPSLRSLGFEPIEERFDDEGYSDSTLGRPALQRLLNVVHSGGIEQLAIYRLDRFVAEPAALHDTVRTTRGAQCRA